MHRKYEYYLIFTKTFPLFVFCPPKYGEHSIQAIDPFRLSMCFCFENLIVNHTFNTRLGLPKAIKQHKTCKSCLCLLKVISLPYKALAVAANNNENATAAIVVNLHELLKVAMNTFCHWPGENILPHIAPNTTLLLSIIYAVTVTSSSNP